jgi:tRNA(Ile)-lysidine synthase
MFDPIALHKKLIKLTANKKFLIAYSGGMDSHVLLHSMQQHPEFQLRAVHVHHGLSKNADQWVEHCRKICSDLNIEFIVKYISVKPSKKHSPEALARELRYQEFAQLLQKDECLLTAHHANDQAETLLLQMFRGSGPKGLAAMPEHKGFMSGSLIRPLLEFSRADLHTYAIQNNLNWIEDESNENIGLDRNFIRHKLMPIIKQKWLGILKTLSRVADHCASASELLTILAEQDYAKIQGSKPNTLSIKKLLQLNSAGQNNVIRYWLHKLDFPTPTSIKLEHIKTDVLLCRADANPIVHWPGVEIRRYRDDLYAMLPIKKSVKIPRQSGRKLKKMFQQQGIPPWQREK